jgi:hypothetical protein
MVQEGPVALGELLEGAATAYVMAAEGAAPHGFELTAGRATYVPPGPTATFDAVAEGSAFELRLWQSGRASWDETSLVATGRRPDLARGFRLLHL